jgi:hypothetical protein
VSNRSKDAPTTEVSAATCGRRSMPVKRGRLNWWPNARENEQIRFSAPSNPPRDTRNRQRIDIGAFVSSFRYRSGIAEGFGPP